MEIKLLTQTLFASGYLLEGSVVIPGSRLLLYSRQDDFGCEIRYLLAVPEGPLTDSFETEVVKYAQQKHALPVILAPGQAKKVPTLSVNSFLARFGGAVVSLLPLEANYPAHLRVLGQNLLPPGMMGRADTVFEDYIKAGLQFLFGTKVVGYGQSRTGESVPDGIALREGRYVLYDAKAASSGYSVTRPEMRKFADYTNTFHRNYRESYGKAYCFLVISGTFADSADSLRGRSSQLYSETDTRLCFMDVEAILAAVEEFNQAPSLREGIDWGALLSQDVVDEAKIRSAVKKARKDKMGCV